MHTKQAVMLTLSPEIRFTQQRITLTAQNIGQLSAYKQWGYAGNSGGSVDVTFPVSFTKTVYQIQLTYNSDSYENPTYAIKDTKSFRYWSKYGGDKLWLAIGAQQWGFGESPYATPTTYTYPLAYSVNALNVVIGSVGGRESTCRINSVSKDSFVAYRHYSGSGDLYWLAIGVQQWGRSTAATLNFSLPFQKFYCITTAQESWGSATFDNTSWITRTNISVTWPTYQGTNINYIAVGMQQCFKRCAFGKAQALPMDSHQKPAQPLPLS